MLTIKKRNKYIFNAPNPTVTITNLDYLMNPNKGYTTLNFDLTNESANLRLEGFEIGQNYFFDMKMNVDNEVIYGMSEGRMGINGYTHYFDNDTETITTSFIATSTYVDIYINGLNSSGIFNHLYGFINRITITTNKWYELDVDKSQIKITNSIKLTDDLSKVSTIYSKEFDIILNKQNLKALDIHPNFITNFNNTIAEYDVRYALTDVNFLGKLSIQKIVYENNSAIAKVNIISNLSSFIQDIDDNRLKNILLPEVTYDIANVKAYQFSETHDVSNETFCFVLHDWGQNITERYLNHYYEDKAINKNNVILKIDYDQNTANSKYNINENYVGLTTDYKSNFINNWVPALFVKKIFKNIHTKAGFNIEGDFLETDTFNELLMLPSNFEHIIDDEDNHFEISNPSSNQTIVLAEGTSKSELLYGTDVSQNNTLSGTSTKAVFYGMVDTYQVKEGLYTDIDYEIEYKVWQSNGTGSYLFNYNAEIYIEYANISSPGNRELLDYQEEGEFMYSGSAKTFTISGTLEDVYIPFGYGYRDLQIRMNAYNYNNGALREITYEITKFNITNKGKIKSKYAPSSIIKLNDLLPDLSERELVKNIITMFNLYPVFENNTITYYTYDEFLAKGKIVDLNKVLVSDNHEIIIPNTYVASEYNFYETQDDRGEIQLIGKTESLPYGNYKINSVFDNDITQDFNLLFGIPIKQDIRMVGSSIHWIFGRNSRQNLNQTRSIWSGRNGKDNYYNDFEITDQFIFGRLHRKNYPSIYMVNEFLEQGTSSEVLVLLNTAIPDGLSYEELYENYYENQLTNLNNTSSLKLIIKGVIDERTFADCDLWNIFLIDNAYYYLESIKDWNNESLTTLTFIKLLKNPLYNN